MPRFIWCVRSCGTQLLFATIRDTFVIAFQISDTVIDPVFYLIFPSCEFFTCS